VCTLCSFVFAPRLSGCKPTGLDLGTARSRLQAPPLQWCVCTIYNSILHLGRMQQPIFSPHPGALHLKAVVSPLPPAIIRCMLAPAMHRHCGKNCATRLPTHAAFAPPVHGLAVGSSPAGRVQTSQPPTALTDNLSSSTQASTLSH